MIKFKKSHMAILCTLTLSETCCFMPLMAKTVNIDIPAPSLHKFVPPDVRVNPGDEIIWTNHNENKPGNIHSVSPDNDEDFQEKDPLNPGESYKIIAPAKIGVIGYHCNYHGAPGSGMAGTITVEAP